MCLTCDDCHSCVCHRWDVECLTSWVHPCQEDCHALHFCPSCDCRCTYRDCCPSRETCCSLCECLRGSFDCVERIAKLPFIIAGLAGLGLIGGGVWFALSNPAQWSDAAARVAVAVAG